MSRVNPKDTSHHVILGSHEFRPLDFASQINLNMDNAWGILRCVIDYFMKCEAGTYLMLKDPNKVSFNSASHSLQWRAVVNLTIFSVPLFQQSLHIYALPPNTFASDDEDSQKSPDEQAQTQQQGQS